MTELVKHRRDVAEREKRRLPCRRLREVGHVKDHRLRSGERVLVDEIVHPCAAAFLVTLEVVGVKQRERLSISVEDLEYPHVGMIDGNILPLLERQPVQLVRGEEDSIPKNAIELEVRLELRLVESISRLSDLLRVVLIIPRCQLEPALLPVDQILHLTNLGACLCCRCGDEIGEKLRRVGWSLRHLIVERECRIARKAKQLRPLRAKLGEPLHDSTRIVRIIVLGTRCRRDEEPLANCAILQRRLRGMLRRVLERNDPLAFEVALLCSRGGGRNLTLAHPIEEFHVIDDERACLGGGKKAALELGRQLRLFLVQITELRLVSLRKIGAGSDEVSVVVLDQRLLLLVESKRVTPIVQALHALVQLVIEEDRVVMIRELRSDLLLNCLERVGRVRARQRIENFRHASENCARSLEWKDRVVERRRTGLICNSFYFSDLLAHSRLECGSIIGLLDRPEIRRLIRKSARRRKRIGCGERGNSR